MDPEAQAQDPVDVHKPFTKAENIQQLAEIDNDITLLLTHTGKAIQALAQPTSGNTEDGSSGIDGTSTTDPREPAAVAAQLDPEARLESFKTAMNAFMKTLHSVDVRLKRQIWGLEEAGIITLKSTDRRDTGPEAAGPAGPTGSGGPGTAGASGADAPAGGRLEPNGIGSIGTLDVGWLNSRSNKVERVMESELWVGAREHLEGIAAAKLKVAGDGDDDTGVSRMEE